MKTVLLTDGIIAPLRASGKKQVLQELSHKASELLDVSEHDVFEALLERERLGSTGIGKGVAIPHCRLDGLEKVCGIFAHVDPAVEFDAVDNQPVDLVFMLLAPSSAGADHLRALATVSRLLRDDAICRKLRGSSKADAIRAILLQDRE